MATLVISHDLLVLTSRLAGNLSANMVGAGLGTRVPVVYLPRFVFTGPEHQQPAELPAVPVPEHAR